MWADMVFSSDMEERLGKVENNFEKLRDLCLDLLLEEAFLDIGPYFSQILSPEWMNSHRPVDKIIATLFDAESNYFKDYNQLQPRSGN